MSPTRGLPLALGAEGEAVRDVQRRLAALGLACAPDPEGTFGAATRAAVEAFQRRRGLRIDAIVGPSTWATLVEASYSLGDRPLYRRATMQRGDDVAELQRRLCALGFDTGRVDGIFGDATQAAVAEFQRNAGLPDDGAVGAVTLEALLRVAPRTADPELVTAVRDRLALRLADPTLSGRAIAIGSSTELSTAAHNLARRLTELGATVTVLEVPDESAQAAAANAASAELFLGLRLTPETAGCRTMFYKGYTYESASGRLLGELLQARLPRVLAIPGDAASGMALAVLRETKMTAVVVEVGPAEAVVRHGDLLATSIAEAVERWATEAALHDDR